MQRPHSIGVLHSYDANCLMHDFAVVGRSILQYSMRAYKSGIVAGAAELLQGYRGIGGLGTMLPIFFEPVFLSSFLR